MDPFSIEEEKKWPDKGLVHKDVLDGVKSTNFNHQFCDWSPKKINAGSCDTITPADK